jgi:hypothetical protein
MNTLDKQDEKGIFALFKGPSGSGKSVGALSFPVPYVFDFDHKLPAIARKHFPGKSVEYDTFDDINDVANLIKSWLSGQVSCPYETLIYDSITSLARLIMNSIAKAKGEDTPTMLKTILATRGGQKMVELMGYDYYNAEVRFIDWILSANKLLWSAPGNPKNIIFIAHIVTVETKPDLKTKMVTKTRSIMALGNRAPAMIPGEFDEVYMFGTSEQGGLDSPESQIHHHVITQTSGEDDAKTAYNLARETDFTKKSLYDLLKGQIAGAEMFT